MRNLNSQAKDLSNIHSGLWSQSFIDAESDTDIYRTLLKTVPGSNKIPNTDLGRQLNMVYRLMKLRTNRGVDRDVFACQIGGFDQHFSLKSSLVDLFKHINGALAGFRSALKDEGLWDRVTLVMTSGELDPHIFNYCRSNLTCSVRVWTVYHTQCIRRD